jgi:hypothetical protein
MSNRRISHGESPVEGISPTDSLDTLFSKTGSPTEKLIVHSPQSLHAKPWPARPQRLHRGFRGWKWQDSARDGVIIMMPVPFFLLAAAVVAVNGKVVQERDLAILDHSIKGVSKPSLLFNRTATELISTGYHTFPNLFRSDHR